MSSQEPSPIVSALLEAPTRLPHLVRFRDLRAAGIIDNWPSLYSLIENYGFPEGTLISANIKAWDLDEIHRWLNSRPKVRKIVPLAARRPPRRRAAKISTAE